MKRLFIGSGLLLSATIFLTGCISHAPVKSVHIVQAYPNHFNASHIKNHAFTTHPNVKVYQTHYPKVVQYKPQRSSSHIYEQPIHKQRNGYVKTYKSTKPYKSNNDQNHAYSKKNIVINKRTVKVVQKSRPIVVTKPKNQVHQSRHTDIQNLKRYKNGEQETSKKHQSNIDQPSEKQRANNRTYNKYRTNQYDNTYSRR